MALNAKPDVDAAVRTIKTPAAVVSYRDIGEGPVLLCLHGTGPGASGWGNYAAVAEKLAAGYRLIVPDLPGFGKSVITADTDVPFAKMAAAELLDFLGQLGIGRAHVVGNSAGGAVAARMSLARPDLIASLVLMGCAGLRVPLFSPRELEGVRLLRTYRPNPSLEKMRAIIKAFLYDPSIVDVERLAQERYEETLDPKNAAGAERIARDRPRSLQLSIEELEKIDAPTLLLWGREDRFVGVDDAFVFLASIPNARLVLLPNCGHWVQIERPDDFVAQVCGFASMIDGLLSDRMT